MLRDELAGWLRLTLTPGVGNGACRKLLAAFGLPSSVFSQSVDALSQVVSPRLAQALQALPPGFDASLDAASQWLAGDAAAQRRIMTLADADYPQALLETDDPPPMLYIMGALDRLIDPGRSIAIVGSRNPTPPGESNARLFAQALGDAGLTVVSGLALGVDGAAHLGALQSFEARPTGRLSTVAVIGTGLDRVYPRRHLALAHRICASGLIMSEFPLGTPPQAANFPQRNRIISALARATLVVEAAVQSGSLITARLAAVQGRDVMAIPGSIHSAQSRGCHLLIKQGAKLVESARDVLDELSVPFADAPQPALPPEPEDEAAGDESGGAAPALKLLDTLGFDPVGLDALVARTGAEPARLLAELVGLELDGLVVRLPGGLFQRMAMA